MTDRLADVVRRAQKHMPAELWAQVRALLTPEAAAVMGTVTAAWAVSHFFGVGEIADLLLLVTGGAVFGTAALEIAHELYSFVSLTRTARTELELEEAARHLARAVVLGGTTAVGVLLLRARPRAFHRPKWPGATVSGPGPRGPGWFYRPKVYVEPLDAGTLGVTTVWGDIILNAKIPARVRAETLIHEKVHRFLTPKLYFLRELRATLSAQGYNRSHLLRYLEEVAAEANLMLRTGGGSPLGLPLSREGGIRYRSEDAPGGGGDPSRAGQRGRPGVPRHLHRQEAGGKGPAMGRIRDALTRLANYFGYREEPLPATRLSAEEAVGLAVMAADRKGHVLDPPIRAWPDDDSDYAEKGRLVWTVLSNAGLGTRGGHVRVIIDDATGETVALHVLPR